MRTVCPRRPGGAWCLSAVLVLGISAMNPALAKKQPPQRHPLVLPCQCLTYMQQLNAGTGFRLVCLSQASVSGSARMIQTAVLDLSPPVGSTDSSGSFPLFMFPQDVPVVQQLNGGMGIQTTAIIPVTDVTGQTIPVAQVSVPGPGQGRSQNQTGQTGRLLVCPVSSLALMEQLNPGLSVNVLCISQVGAGNSNPASQTALLDVQPTHGIVDPSQPLPMLVPLDTLSALGQLNSGSIIDVTEITTTSVGNSAVLPVALINITQNEQSLDSSNSAAKGSGDDEQDDSQDHGKGGGKHQSQGNSKDHGKGQDKAHGRGHGEDDD